MSRHYGTIAFTPAVADVQAHYGSRDFFARQRQHRADEPGPDALTADAQEFLSEREGFYLATVSETTWPYVQFRGGTPGFLHVLDEHTIAWADFRGNLQYVSMGNLAGNDRVAMIAVDHARQLRLKLFGHARVATLEQEPDLIASLRDPEDDAVVERAVVIAVEAYDWNCPQHITPLFSAAQIQPVVENLQAEIAALQADNAALRQQLTDRS